MLSMAARDLVSRCAANRRSASRPVLAAVLLTAGAVVAMPCAQTSVNSSTQQLPSSSGGGSGSATSMWGAGTGSGSASQSSLDSATMHDTLGQSAALSQSAKRGFLYSQGTSIVLESIGAQSIVNTSIYGDNNIANVSANQTSSNSGNVNANGAITLSGNATTTVGGATTGSGSTSGATANPKATTPGGSGSAAKSGNVQAGTTTLSSSSVGSPPSGDVPGSASDSGNPSGGGG
jgi:hypothetical protein